MKQRFIDRYRELEFLEQKYREKGPQLIVIYGRRRIGKTELIREFLKQKNGAYIYCTTESFRENMRTFAMKFQELTGKRYFEEARSLEYLFETLVDVIGEARVIIAIDELPYLVSVKPSVPSQLQKIFDETLTGSNIFLILCGSSIGMMERELLEYQSPLFGRKTGEWKLEPFTIRDIAHSTGLQVEPIFQRWSRFGGTPAYFIQSIEDMQMATRRLLTKGEPLYSEPLSLLREELREPRSYLQLLRYIASGITRQGKLQQLTGLDKGNVSRYLDILGSLGYVERVIPIGRKRGGQYRIKDPFFNFWFRYVYPNYSYLEIGQIEPVQDFIEKDMERYRGILFERFIEAMIREGTLDLKVAFVSRWWHKEREIDLVGVGRDHAVFIEIKWQKLRRAESRRIIDRLREKVPHTGIDKANHVYGLICRDTVKPELSDDEFVLTISDLDDILNDPDSFGMNQYMHIEIPQ
ncbi:MAG: ATP-binding protein [Thermoplasmata archaeon]|nr:ATP-binding protein [Thermoplasmata archaeon]